MADTTKAPLVYDGLPDLEEGFKSWKDLLQGILRNVYAEVPNHITNVKISNESPDDGQTDFLWGQRDNAGNFVGFNVFAQGDWRLVSTPSPPQTLYLIHGDSENPPPGFSVVNTSNVGVSDLAKLQESWNPSNTEGPWSLFHVVYAGF